MMAYTPDCCQAPEDSHEYLRGGSVAPGQHRALLVQMAEIGKPRLPEVDPVCTDRGILLADRRDGEPIDAKYDLLRVIVPGEKRPARWVKQVIALQAGRA
jgi:hypothetical protein